MATPQQAKKKCRQYSVEYLKYGFVSAPHNQYQPICLLYEKVFSNEAMKPSRLLEHLKKYTLIKQTTIWHILSNFKKSSRNEKLLEICLLSLHDNPLMVLVNLIRLGRNLFCGKRSPAYSFT